MAHRDRVGGSSGRRKGAGDARHRQNFSTPSEAAYATATAAYQGFRTASRTLLAENLGKPSPWVMINAPWYDRFQGPSALGGDQKGQRPFDVVGSLCNGPGAKKKADASHRPRGARF